ncbi:MAG TPA: AAA family ATPase [Allocoleopsis sp.]
MLTKFTIKNFRCFHELTLENLSRLNLIGGMNNVGKTSLLEALFLHLGANLPDLALKINFFRGIEQFKPHPESIFYWLFFNKNMQNSIEFITYDHNQIKNSLTMTINQDEIDFTEIDFTENIRFSSSSNSNINPQKIFLSYDKNSQKYAANFLINADGSLRGKIPFIQVKPCIFIISTIRSTQEDYERFSNIDKLNRQAEILQALQLLEPRLKRLAVLIEGNLPVIAGDIGIGELIPIPYMGEGFSRLLSILLAIANTPDGVVLIDEIENGLHHSKIVEIWQAIDLISQKNNTQIFATTHSFECIESAHQAFFNSPDYNFSYYRLERKKEDNQIKVLSYNQNTINTSIDLKLEMR